ncbi:glycosyltransferase family 2 protein [Nocardioides sp. Leaf307]|uniref:glycosyltransferase family 2 protein n=1 Tax=Nocardioides sp. Leaf307 TaxID=1736331 RepID=UPI000702F1D3|nr:glycosyltransferase family A protein [Nocardioides sp. Leaf307]KQQ42949.1 hypothetical protein ASF50_02740 [Nocardioides sp. Leaf307]
MIDSVDVSVVIPCHNGAQTITRQLDALAAQRTAARFEVLVADNRSTDDSRAVVTDHPLGARLVDAHAAPGINVARNAGLEAARGALILFCDADDVVHAGWIEAFWTAYSHGARAMGGALRRVRSDGTATWQRELNEGLDFLPWPTGANCAIARSVLDQIGIFDPELRGGGDETDLFWRAQLAGHELVLVDEATIDYHQRPTARSTHRQRVAFGRSHVRLFLRFRDRGMPRRVAGRSAWYLASTLARGIRSGDLRTARTSMGAQASIIVGRVQQSLRSGTFYV